jgi:hypothetical protein
VHIRLMAITAASIFACTAAAHSQTQSTTTPPTIPTATHQMVTMVKVADYDKWLAGYQPGETNRSTLGGFRTQQIFHSASDPNTVIILYSVDDITKATAYIRSPQSRQTQAKIGVTVPPEIFMPQSP